MSVHKFPKRTLIQISWCFLWLLAGTAFVLSYGAATLYCFNRDELLNIAYTKATVIKMNPSTNQILLGYKHKDGVYRNVLVDGPSFGTFTTGPDSQEVDIAYNVKLPTDVHIREVNLLYFLHYLLWIIATGFILYIAVFRLRGSLSDFLVKRTGTGLHIIGSVIVFFVFVIWFALLSEVQERISMRNRGLNARATVESKFAHGSRKYLMVSFFENDTNKIEVGIRASESEYSSIRTGDSVAIMYKENDYASATLRPESVKMKVNRVLYLSLIGFLLIALGIAKEIMTVSSENEATAGDG